AALALVAALLCGCGGVRRASPPPPPPPVVYAGGKLKPAPRAHRRRAPERLGAWPTYGFDLARTRFAPFHLRPPFHRVWRRFVGGVIEFPPVAARGRLYVAQLQGNFL